MKLKKRVACMLFAVTLLLTVVCLAGCNTQLIDTTYKFDEAIIKLPDGTVVSGKVESWKDYSDSDAIQIKINGTTYYTFLGNVVLIQN